MEANKLTHLPKRHRSQRCDSFTGYICSIPSYLPSFSVWCVCVCVCAVCVCVCVCAVCVSELGLWVGGALHSGLCAHFIRL